MTEKEQMTKHVLETACPDCGGSCVMAGGVKYTDPLDWEWKCTACKTIGTIGYTSSDLRGPMQVESSKCEPKKIRMITSRSNERKVIYFDE